MRIDRRTFLAGSAVLTSASAFAFTDPPQGRIETIPKLDAGNKAEPRIRIWLPPGYGQSTAAHRTLYMLDGQFAFAGDSGETNFATDRRVARLMATDTIAPTIIIAIDNLEDERFLQYIPQTIYDRGDSDIRATVERERNRLGGKPLVSAEFIRFLEEPLKPYVDSHYRTAPARNDTAIFGASMAGVMAGAIFVEGQASFGRGACMSPNWAIYDDRFIDHAKLPAIWGDYFAQLGAPDGRRLWLDHGTQMMDAGMVPHQKAIAQNLSTLGWVRGCNLQTRVYEAGHAFAETAAQMDDVLAWILG